MKEYRTYFYYTRQFKDSRNIITTYPQWIDRVPRVDSKPTLRVWQKSMMRALICSISVGSVQKPCNSNMMISSSSNSNKISVVCVI